MLKKITNYIKDTEFRINIYNDKANIVNYLEIIIMEPNRVTLKHKKGVLTIKGTDLTINKILESEALITGDIKTIELS